MFQGKAFGNLVGNKNKGENGTIVVVGGSHMYTGAPVFSAKAALRSGSDIVYIFSNAEAVDSIKSLHEAIVMSLKIVPRILDKATACVIGPGLGELTGEALSTIMEMARYLGSRNVPIILDADAVHLYKQGVFHDIESVILTPNHKEAINLSPRNGHICVYKSKEDAVELNGTRTCVSNESSLKRCGGQGDILSGVLATAVSLSPKDLVDACVSACELSRASSKLAFDQKGYSLITNDIFDAMPAVLEDAIRRHRILVSSPVDLEQNKDTTK